MGTSALGEYLQLQSGNIFEFIPSEVLTNEMYTSWENNFPVICINGMAYRIPGSSYTANQISMSSKYFGGVVLIEDGMYFHNNQQFSDDDQFVYIGPRRAMAQTIEPRNFIFKT